MSLDPPEIHTLRQLSLSQLRARWQEVMGSPPPIALSREVLYAYLAWQLQAQHGGGLPPPIQRKLNSLVSALAGGKGPRSPQRSARFQAGTVLTRAWRGTSHTVVVQPDGFAFEGERYRSLSDIARRITGTHWNGTAFFGLRRNTTSVSKKKRRDAQ